MLHCDITGTGSHSILLLPGALGMSLRNRLLLCMLCASCLLLFPNVLLNYQLSIYTILLTISYLFTYLLTFSGHIVLSLRLAIIRS